MKLAVTMLTLGIGLWTPAHAFTSAAGEFARVYGMAVESNRAREGYDGGARMREKLREMDQDARHEEMRQEQIRIQRLLRRIEQQKLFDSQRLYGP